MKRRRNRLQWPPKRSLSVIALEHFRTLFRNFPFYLLEKFSHRSGLPPTANLHGNPNQEKITAESEKSLIPPHNTLLPEHDYLEYITRQNIVNAKIDTYTHTSNIFGKKKVYRYRPVKIIDNLSSRGRQNEKSPNAWRYQERGFFRRKITLEGFLIMI